MKKVRAAAAVPATRGRGQRSGFWAAAFAFLIVMTVATLPSPLYGLYRIRDHLSALTITVVFAIFAAGTIVMLRGDNAIVARLGRRGVMLAAVATMMVAMAELAVWKDLPGLLIGRLITGVSVGLAAGPRSPTSSNCACARIRRHRPSGPGPSAPRSPSAPSASARWSPAASRSG